MAVTTFYELRDAAGNPVAVHKRVDGDDGGKTFSWLRPDGTSGLNGMAATDLPLYGAELLAGWDCAATRVVVVEGEKSADSLRSRGVPAVATVCGANNVPSPAVLADLRGRHVALWPDNDDLGKEHMVKVGTALHGVAAGLYAVDWHDAPPKGDAADYDGDPWDVLDAAASWQPPGMPLRGRDYWYAADIEIPDRPSPMALHPLLLDEGPSVAFGDGDTGKSALAQLAASAVATGRDDLVEGHEPAVTGPVLWADFESSRLRFARRQRLIVPAAPVIYVPCHRPIWDEAEKLARIVEAEGVVAAVVDSIIPATAGSRLSEPSDLAGRYFNAVGSIARRSLSLGHVPKRSRDDDKPFGSVFFHNLARLTWRLDRDPTERDKHSVRLTNFKHNDGDRFGPLDMDLVWTDDTLRAMAGLIRPLTKERMDGLLAEIESRDGLAFGAEIRRARVVEHLSGDPRRVGATRLSELLDMAVDAGLVERVRKGVFRRTSGNPGGNPVFGLSDE